MAEQIYRSLRADILTVRHRPGTALTEQSLAAAYRASRVPVREACRRLQQEGLLEAIPYKGYFVSRVSVREITDCFDLRIALETHALARAMDRVKPEEIGRLQELAVAQYTYHDRESYIEFLDRNQDFHARVAALAGNARLVVILRELLSTMQRFFFLGLDLGDFGGEMRGEHEQLLALMAAGRKEDAVTCLRSQIECSRDRILRALVDERSGIPLE